MEESMKFAPLTGTIIGCAMNVHRQLGNGFREIVYQRCLYIELKKMGLECKREVPMEIFYESEWVGTKKLDIIVGQKVLIEIKVLPELNKTSYSQVINYLKVFDLEVGLLLNFGMESLQFKRFVHSKSPRNPFQSHNP